MVPLTLDDLIPLEEYAGRRAEFFAQHQRYLDRYRRVRLGPHGTLVFENRQTLWFRLHELLRVARLADPTRVQRELDWYNRLLPIRGRLQAAFVIAPELAGVDPGEGRLRLIAGDAVVPALLVTNRPEDIRIGLAHWVEFPCGPRTRAALADPRQAARFEWDGPDSTVSASVHDEVRQSLVDDLDLG